MGWCIFIIIVLLLILSSTKSDYNQYKTKAETEISKLKVTIENLKDPNFVMKEKRIMDAQINSLNKLTTYDSIKVSRIPLGNLVRAFKSDSVWLQLKDLLTLEITDGYSTVTLPCSPEKKKELR